MAKVILCDAAKLLRFKRAENIYFDVYVHMSHENDIFILGNPSDITESCHAIIINGEYGIGEDYIINGKINGCDERGYDISDFSNMKEKYFCYKIDNKVYMPNEVDIFFNSIVDVEICPKGTKNTENYILGKTSEYICYDSVIFKELYCNISQLDWMTETQSFEPEEELKIFKIINNFTAVDYEINKNRYEKFSKGYFPLSEHLNTIKDVPFVEHSDLKTTLTPKSIYNKLKSFAPNDDSYKDLKFYYDKVLLYIENNGKMIMPICYKNNIFVHTIGNPVEDMKMIKISDLKD